MTFGNLPPIFIVSILIMCVTIPFIIVMICWICTTGSSASCRKHCNYSNEWTSHVIVPLINYAWNDSLENEFMCEATMVNRSIALVTSDCIDIRKLDRDKYFEYNYRLRFGSSNWFHGGITREVTKAGVIYGNYNYTNPLVKEIVGNMSRIQGENISDVLREVVGLRVQSPFNRAVLIADDQIFDKTSSAKFVDFKARTKRNSYERYIKWNPFKNTGNSLTLDKNCKSIGEGMPSHIFCGSFKQIKPVQESSGKPTITETTTFTPISDATTGAALVSPQPVKRNVSVEESSSSDTSSSSSSSNESSSSSSSTSFSSWSSISEAETYKHVCKYSGDDYAEIGHPLMADEYLIGIQIYRVCLPEVVYIFKRIFKKDIERALARRIL